ncbi:NACHT, LRR and PYD domains-containing protein 3-like isoform X2 [Callorhinchus milii]|uniref:NACHT, LRR and PYD domains-containing protein 3-like isoform X2 n=1 Tax=Callorhinchus milii TaxID=7868 RepID=UPI0004575D31|nr:NACHT, LRR and PYD domains-containing protein 3-like isoform X2 [Callorhinchus milii]|eukprot:gi/632983258/ref/XP_007908557.1/ PREDICTED: NACHT, LRR and PYD domains-containing protein 3-like isoform X2 [Callorhinchus milii]
MAEAPNPNPQPSASKENQTETGLMETFSKTLDLYDEYQLLKLTKVYRHRIEQAIEVDMEGVITLLTRNEHLSQPEQQKLTELTKSGQTEKSSKLLLNLVLGKGSRVSREMWKTFAEMRTNFPKMNKIMTEIQKYGSNLINQVMNDQRVPEVPSNLEDVQRLHKATLQKQSERLEVKTILIKEKVKIFQLIDRYMELTIISDTRHRKLVEHELLARGRDHEEWRQKELRGKLEKIRTDKLFHSSFSKGSHLHTSQRRGSDSPTGTSAVFRDLNTIHDRTTLSRLIAEQYPYLRDILDELWKHPKGLLFIFDGLDEFRRRIDFGQNRRDAEPRRRCTDPQFLCDISDIVYSLIQKNLLPGCSVLVTSRPTALYLLSKAQVSVWAEILGFVGDERKEYFHKFFEDEELAASVYSHVEENELLLTMCYNPSYCWILGLSLGPFFTRKHNVKQQIPKTITQLFSYYIYHILTHHSVKMESLRNEMLNIGEMAFTGVSQRNIVFNNEDLIKCELQSSKFLSGFLMDLLEEECSEHNAVYTFPHLTIQEFVAALAQFLPQNPGNLRKLLNEAHKNEDGRFEIFLRFVAGLSSPRAAQPLEEFLGPFCRQRTCAVIDWLKETFKAQIKDVETVTGQRKLLNTLHYLFESQNKALTQLTLGSVQKLTFGDSASLRLTPIDCVVLAHTIGLCDTIQHLDLESSYIQDEGLQRLIPALQKCQHLSLYNNNLTADCAEDLASALSVNGSLITLELGHNNLGDLGVKRLCVALRNPACKLQALWLTDNNLTDACTKDLVSALNTNRSLTALNLGSNELGDSGVKQLCLALRNPKCKIKTLELISNRLTDGCTVDLISALIESCTLRELNLMSNSITDVSIPALRRCILKCTSLKEIELVGNHLSSHGKKQLRSLQGTRCGLSVIV